MNRQADLSKEKQKKLRENFSRDGFIYFPGFLNRDELEIVNKKIQEFITLKVPHMPSDQVYYEDKSDKNTLKQLQQLCK